MSIYSEKYAQHVGAFYGYNVTYPWSDPNVDPTYYQSYVTSGEPSIDPSIFQIIRLNDPWSLGANYSFWSNSEYSDHPRYREPTWECVPNNYKKNVDAFSRLNTNDLFNVMSYNSSNPGFYNGAKYSPDAISYSVDYGQFFLRDYDYNNLVILPKFWYVYWEGNTWGSVDGYYNDVLAASNQHPDGLVMELSMTLWYGAINQGESSRYSFPFSPYIQFAGNVPLIKYNTSVLIKAVYRDGYTSGVFLGNQGHSGSHSSRIFYTPGYNPSTNQTDNGPSSHVTHIIPFSSDLLVRHTATGPTDMRYGLTLEDAKTIIDRLGYNWAKSLNAAYYSKTGSWCTDSDLRCPVIDPETNTVTTDINEGVSISDYAINHPNSNYNWGSGDPEFAGPTMIQVAENTDPAQATIEPADEIDLNEPTAATLGGTALWILSKTDIDIFFNWMWDPQGSSFDDIVKGVALLGNNPMDSLISLKVFPLNLQQYVNYDQKTVCFGRTACDALHSKLHVISSNVINLDLGGFSFNEAFTFKDFRDYEPYSDYSLYLPFCGIIHLSAVECVNTTISIKYIIDIITGSCTAVVFTNGVPYQYINGMIGIEMPLTGRNLSDYANTVMSAALGGSTAGGFIGNKAAKAASANGYGDSADNWAHASQALKSGNVPVADAFATDALMGPALASPTVMGLAFGVAGAAIGGTISALTNAPAIESKGSNTPATGLSKPFYPYLIVRHSETWYPENYNKLYGRPLIQGGVVGDFHGFSTFGNIKVDDIEYATSEEKVLISELLTKGVYL